MCTYKKRWATGLFVSALMTFPGCTPARNSAANTEWVVANQTPDTLWVTVRFALDSAQVPLANVAACQQRLATDSADQRGIGFFLRQHLTRLTAYRGQWYWVDSGMEAINTRASCDTSAGHQPQIKRVLGMLTYQLPPHCTQTLVYTMSRPGSPWPTKLPIIGLQLRQGKTQRVVLPGQSLQHVFQLQPTGHEHDYSARYLCQFTVKHIK